jgi:hypothetical protein
MEGDKILMGQKRLQMFQGIRLVEGGKIPLKEAAVFRQTKRIRNREKGIGGLPHGITGKSSKLRTEE